MPDQYAVAVAQRAALLRGDRAVSRVVLDAYYKAWQSISERLSALTRQLADARASGVEPGASWLYEQDRLLSLQRQVSQEVTVVASRLVPFLAGEQARWVEQAGRDTAALVQAAQAGTVGGVSTSLSLLHPASVENVIGFLSDGSPLHTLLQELGPDAAKRVGDALIQGVALGKGPRDIARQVRSAFAGNMARALLVSRDAVIRSYQESAHQTYLANADVLSGWRWLAAHSPRTCPSCLAMSGTLHPLTERLREHPGGRCTPIPEVRDNPLPFGPTGADWFDAQPDAVQREIVGPRKFEALSKGLINLEDLTIKRRSARWGSHWGEASYAEALKNAAARTAGEAPSVARPVGKKTVGEQVRKALLKEHAARQRMTAAAQAEADRLSAQFHDATEALFAHGAATLDARYDDPVVEAEFARLKSIQERVGQEAMAAADWASRLQNTSTAAAREALYLPAPPPGVVRQRIAAEVPASLRKPKFFTAADLAHIQEGADFINRVMDWGVPDDPSGFLPVVEVGGSSSGRSYHTDGRINLGAGSHRDVPIVVHELSHELEHRNPAVQAERRAFLLRRTAGDTLERMADLTPKPNGYKDTEWTRKDAFHEPYVGVDYSYTGPVDLTAPLVRDASGNAVSPRASTTNTGGHPSSSEVISMGVQALYENPVAFARNDPDYFDFIIGVLRRGSPAVRP